MTRPYIMGFAMAIMAASGCIDAPATEPLNPRPCDFVDDQGARIPCHDTSYDAQWVPLPSWPQYECAVRQAGETMPFGYDILKPGPNQDGDPFLLRFTAGIPNDGLGVFIVGTPELWHQINVHPEQVDGSVLVIPQDLGETIGFAFQWFHSSWNESAAVETPLELVPTARPLERMDSNNPMWNNWLVLKAGNDHAFPNALFSTENGAVVSETSATMRVDGQELVAHVVDEFEVGYSGRITVPEQSDLDCTHDYLPVVYPSGAAPS